MIQSYIIPLVNNRLLGVDANYKVDDLEYTNKDIKDIDLFRGFVKLIYNNKDIPQNKTLMYDDAEDLFYFYSENDWIPFDTESNIILIDMIFEKIKSLIIEKRFHLEEIIKDLEFYIGNNYDINIIEYDNVKDIKLDNTDQRKFSKILKLDYKKKFALHQINKN
mgnify:CR=1 FL=1